MVNLRLEQEGQWSSPRLHQCVKRLPASIKVGTTVLVVMGKGGEARLPMVEHRGGGNWLWGTVLTLTLSLWAQSGGTTNYIAGAAQRPGTRCHPARGRRHRLFLVSFHSWLPDTGQDGASPGLREVRKIMWDRVKVQSLMAIWCYMKMAICQNFLLHSRSS